eukprot:5477389-Pleurochrysis_carterae.AAC.1
MPLSLRILSYRACKQQSAASFRKSRRASAQKRHSLNHRDVATISVATGLRLKSREVKRSREM